MNSYEEEARVFNSEPFVTRTAYAVSVLKRCGVRLSVRLSVPGVARGSSKAVQRRAMSASLDVTCGTHVSV